MSKNKSRDKGCRGEREIVNLLKDHKIDAERVPLSGSCQGSYGGDVRLQIMGKNLTMEVKLREDGFRELYKWLEDRDILCMRADRRDWLVTMKLGKFLELTKG